MATNLTFKTVKTQLGPFHTMRATLENGTVLGEYRILATRPVAEYLDRKFPVITALAANGSAWAMAVSVSGGRVGWKTVKLSERFSHEGYRMRSVPGGYLGDYVTTYSRRVNGKLFRFVRIFWNAGQGGCTLRAYEGVAETLVKEWHVVGPVSMKKAKKG